MSILMALMLASSAAPSIDVSKLQGLGEVHYHLLETADPERTYHIFVSLPAGYGESPERAYPTIYLLDGGMTFPLLATYFHYLALGEEVEDAILVGISYGTYDRAEGNRRSTDFTAPADEVELYGGAPQFQQFLTRDLFPLIEESYRSRADRRVVFGTSIGGQFALYTALTRPDMFWGHIACNPALHRNLPFFLSWRGEGPMPTTDGRVLVAGGSRDNPRFRTPALEWIRHWTDDAVTKPWTLQTLTLDDQTHFSAVPGAFLAGVRWLLPREEPDQP